MNIIPIELTGWDQWLGYVAGLVMSVVVQGEGQDFFMLMFQVLKDRERVIYDLNPLHHLDPRGLPLLVFTGWGWSNKTPTVPDYFPKSWIFHSLIPIAGTIVVFCLVGLMGSIHFFFQLTFLETAAQACTMLAVANLFIPIPPLALGRALCSPFSIYKEHKFAVDSLGTATPTLIIAVAYFMNWPFLRDWVVTISVRFSGWVLAL
jgi:hypothetical protein